MLEIVSQEKYQPGFPNWKGLNELHLPAKPGAQPGVTWCNEAANEIAVTLGFDTSPFLHEKGIGWTSANDMYINAWKNILAGKLKIVPESIAQQLANRGDIYFLLSHSLTGGHGHVAVIAPTDEVYSYDKGAAIIQAGAKNGLFKRADIFNISSITPPIIVGLRRI